MFITKGSGGGRGPGLRPVAPVASTAAGRRQGNSAEAPHRQPQPALGMPVPVTPPQASMFAGRLGAWVPLIAQLIAGRLDMPQSRRLRRASPAEAETAYGKARGLRIRRGPRRGGIRV